jgi:hypothetical protein
MKGFKIPPNRTIGMIILVIVVVSIWVFDLPQEYMGFFGAMTFLLVMGIPDYLRLRKDLQNENVIKAKSMRWYNAWIYPAVLIYLFYDGSLDLITISTLVMLVIYGIFETIRLYHNHYAISDQGIMDLNSRKLIASSDITKVETTNERLAIHTTKYQNDLEFKSANLVSPPWDELVERIMSLQSENTNNEVLKEI